MTSTGNSSSALSQLTVALRAKGAIVTFAVLLVVALVDFTQRLWVSSPAIEDRTWEDLSAVELGEQFTDVDTVKKWIEPYLPKPEAETVDKPKPQKPKPPTPEEKLDALVKKGAHRIGADVVYLRGVLLEDSQYALLTLIDKSMKPRFKVLTLNEQLGDYRLTEVTPKGVVLRSDSDTITMQLFKNNETR